MFGLHCCVGFSLVAESGGSSLTAMLGRLLLRNTGSRAHGLQQLWHRGLVASQHVGNFQIRD